MNPEREKELSERGWTTFSFEGDLLELASESGTPVSARLGGPLIDLLQVKAPDKAHPNSLSARFGTGAFPFHTDGAHHEKVPRFLFMRLIQPKQSLRKTLLLDFRNALKTEENQILCSEMWRFRGGARPFLSPILGNGFLRFDPCIMKPAISGRKVAVNIVNRILEEAPKVAFEWERPRVLVLDNHRMVHSREAEPEGTGEDEVRTLERVLIL
jgi:hypothetical protein